MVILFIRPTLTYISNHITYCIGLFSDHQKNTHDVWDPLKGEFHYGWKQSVQKVLPS